MITIRGKGASAGVAAGPLCFYRRAENKVSRYTVTDRNAEWTRFERAQAAAVEQLGALTGKARAEAGEAAVALLKVHRMLAEDPDLTEAVEEKIKGGGLNAEAAISEAGARFAEMFTAMDDAYIRVRAADIRDVAARILNILSGVTGGSVDSDVPVVLAADVLAPSEIVQFDKSKILGLITSGGSAASHAAILARTMGIPAVIGTGDQLRAEYAGREIILDGGAGIAFIDADAATRARMLQKRGEQEQRELLRRLKGKENITKDGRRVRICCNINSPGDVTAVLENDGGGVGLFRSEFLYLSHDGYPSEEHQFEAYKSVLRAMDGREVVIRTLDAGADKQIDYFGLAKEENPALGNRGLRVCLSRPEIFRTQLRALYRASAYGRLGILLPMVTSVWEVQEAKELCSAVKKELTAEGAAFSGNVALGVMIETPAAAIMSDRLAKEVDFFSCGTNDLIQYTLACDRQNNDLGRVFDPHHPAVLRLLKMAADNAHKNGIWIGVCGELGAEPEWTETLLALGVDELSVPPRAVLPLRRRVRETDVSAVRERLLGDLMSDQAAR